MAGKGVSMRILFIVSVIVSSFSFAVDPDKKTLPINLTESERTIPLLTRGKFRSQAPVAPVRAFGEWEESDALMILWTNKDFIKKAAEKSKAILIADDQSSVGWWERFVKNNAINEENISYIVAPTNSMWIRDYGPWFILDGNNEVGLVDTVYNRPRPLDDEFPKYASRKWGLPNYELNIVHTGGNFYADGHGKAFSSTLVYSENRTLSKKEVDAEMKSFLGIENYVTGKLVPRLTIEHFDTFGKLVAPDTIIWSEFPKGTPYTEDSENYYKKLRRLKSPYGTPYKIYRMKMIPRNPDSNGRDYRAYINSVIHNKFVFMASYGDEYDEKAKRVYEAALPGYEVVLVDAKGTRWGDSIHCRSRNKHTVETSFIFPKVSFQNKVLNLTADVVTTQRDGSVPVKLKVFWKTKHETKFQSEDIVKKDGPFKWSKKIETPRKGQWVNMYVELTDSKGRVKRKPAGAPLQTIDLMF